MPASSPALLESVLAQVAEKFGNDMQRAAATFLRRQGFDFETPVLDADLDALIVVLREDAGAAFDRAMAEARDLDAGGMSGWVTAVFATEAAAAGIAAAKRWLASRPA